jgi:glutaredoxin
VSIDSRPMLTVYLAPECHLCHDALAVLQGLQVELDFELKERDITLDDALHRAYLERIPVVVLDGEELFEYFVDPEILRERLGAERASPGPARQTPGPGRTGSPR